MDHLPFQAVIVDFDRTLLHTDKTVSGYTVQVLREWQDAGARLFAATARPERTIGRYRDLIPFDAVTTLNGARTITLDAVFEESISKQSAESVLEQLDRVEGIVISAETGSGFYANTDIPVWSPIVTDDIRKLPREEKIYKILASHPRLPADRIALTLPDDTYSSVAEQTLLQVMNRTATKWNGIQKMLEAYGISASRAVYFGDDNDDIEPLRQCGCGVAVSNALESVRKTADHVTGSNDEDGVARFLAELTGSLSR